MVPVVRLRLEQAVGDADSLLEVGAATGHRSGGLRHKPARTVGVDLHEPSIEHSRSLGIHDEYLKLNVLEIAEHYEPDSFDAVIALDLIEHLTPEDGTRLLDAMELVARKRVVIFTPNGFLTGRYGGNPWQRHHSGWTPEQMRALGYRVNGLGGVKQLRGEYAAVRWRPAWFWEAVSALRSLSRGDFPDMAFRSSRSKSWQT